MKTQRPPETRYPDKTAYILGAGFSVTAGIPPMSKFLPRAFELLKQYGGEEGGRLAQSLADLIDKNRAIAATHNINLENVEYLFSLVDDKGDVGIQSTKNRKLLFDVIWNTLRLGYRERNLPKERSLFKDQVEHWKEMKDLTTSPNRTKSKRVESSVPRRHFYERPEFGYSGDTKTDTAFNCCIYEAFLSYVLHNQIKRHQFRKGLGPCEEYFADAIITTNYDLVLENKLANFKKANIFYGNGVLDPQQPQQFPRNIVRSWPVTIHEAQTVLPIIKIHGSINWEWSATRTTALWWDPDRNGYDTISTLKKDDYPLAPPTWRKSLQETELFAKLETLAISHLKTAQRIVMIGYSMPTADMYLKYMLAKALNTAEKPQIEIWDVAEPGTFEQAMVNMFGQENRPNLDYYSCGLVGFVKAHGSRTSLATGLHHRHKA